MQYFTLIQWTGFLNVKEYVAELDGLKKAEADKENAAGGHRAVFVSRENFEEHEMALGPAIAAVAAAAAPPKHSSRRPHKKEGGAAECAGVW